MSELGKMLKQSMDAVTAAFFALNNYETAAAKAGEINQDYHTALKSEVQTAIDALNKLKAVLN